MKLKTVIMLSGYKRSGKDFTAAMLDSTFRKQKDEVNLVSFAGPMKQIVSETFDIELSALEKYKNNTEAYKVYIANNSNVIKEITFRDILQRFGTEAMKPVFGNSVWASIATNNILNSEQDIAIISDWRFLSEYDCISTHFNVITIRIDGGKANADLHSSETELDYFNFDYRFDNSIHDGRLERQIKEFVEDVTE